MIKIYLRNIWRFIFLVLIQVLILNNIQLSGFINPYFYILFIILMPFETPKWILIVLSFFLGLSIDIFCDTLGMHASASVFIAFLRPLILGFIAPRDGYEIGTFPRLYYYGFSWFFKYSTILILAHHLFLFYIEVFRFSGFFMTFTRAILSSVFTIILIILSQYLIYRK
ncbi:MAG: rod shape-determining protein MreD [Bacteroidales bacterium]|nr:rod shape-determining protein MreD [Bacteroidales bacterium]